MSSNNSAPHTAAARGARRALIVADADAALQPQLAASGYETSAATLANAARAISEFAPDVAIIELPAGTHDGDEVEANNEDNGVALARRLRADAATYALPIVFAWSENEAATRNAALDIGIDDYFAIATPATEVLARLEALFWRVEAGRRVAPVTGDQRGEIDNFMLMLDSVREEISNGAHGTLALVYAIARENGQTLDKAARDRTLAEAHGFLKLNLRRIDAVAFYGPTTLFVYLPRMVTRSALAALTRLRGEFINERLNSDVAIGLASFPEDGDDVETIIEKAEASAEAARAASSTQARVVAFHAAEEVVPPDVVAQPAATQTAPTQLSASVVSREQETIGSQPPRALNSRVVRETKVEDDIGPAIITPAHAGNRMQSSGADAARAAAQAAAAERERRSSGAVMPRRLLLTVSDAARMAQLNSLIRSAGYEARAAFDGQQALDLLRIERPDLLVLDYELHGINGVETIRRLHKQGGGRLLLPVLLLLPPHNESARNEALQLGARSVVATPYDPAELLSSVRLAGSIE